MKVVSWASGAALAFLVLAAVPSSAGDEVALSRSGVVEALPAIPVRITNETDTTLSLSVTSAACTPRIFLEPGASIVFGDCLRWGLVHQVIAVFYDRHIVHERQLRLLVAMPGRDWIFSREPRPDAAAVAVAARRKS